MEHFLQEDIKIVLKKLLDQGVVPSRQNLDKFASCVKALLMEKIAEDSILMAGNQGNNGEENPMKTKLVENVTQFQVLKSLLKYIKILFTQQMQYQSKHLRTL